MEGSTALSQLAGLNALQVTQETRRPFTGNRYVIRTPAGEELLTAKEEGYVLGGHNRAFTMPLYDLHGLEMMRLQRPQRCWGAEIVVMMQGAVAAVVRQKMTAWYGLLAYIYDDADQPRYRIRGIPYNNIFDYKLQTVDKNTIGVVRKEYGGFMKETFTRLDNYTLHFPVDMELRFKAGVIGACILIDFLCHDGR